MFQYFHDVDAYVEEADRYGSDIVKLELDEDTLRVTLAKVDVYEQVIPDAPLIVDKTLKDLDSAIEFYHGIALQLAEGDVVRHYGNAGETIRGVKP